MNKISIVIPLFNKANFIRETVSGFIDQLQPGDEIIVVDDASTDNGLIQINDLLSTGNASAIRAIYQTQNSGPATTRNIGAESANGDFVLFFDADDIPHPNLLHYLHLAIDLYPNENLFAYDIVIQAHDPSIDLDKFYSANRSQSQTDTDVNFKLLPPDTFAKSCLIGQPICTASSACVRKATFSDEGGFRNGLRYCEDPELWVRLSAVNNLVYIPLKLAIYRDVPASLSYNLRVSPGSVMPYVDTILKIGRESSSIYYKLAANFVLRNLFFSLLDGNRRADVKIFLKDQFRWLSAKDRLIGRLVTYCPILLLRCALALRRWNIRPRTSD